MEEAVSKIDPCREASGREAQMRDNSKRVELDPAEGVRRRCKKNSPSVLSCIDKRTKEGCDCGSEVGKNSQLMR